METALLPLAVSVPWRVVMGCSGQGQVLRRAGAGGDRSGGALTAPGREQISGLVGRRVRFLDLPEDQFRAMLLEDGDFGDAASIETEVLCHLRAWLESQRAAFDRPRRLQHRLIALLLLRYGRYALAAVSS